MSWWFDLQRYWANWWEMHPVAFAIALVGAGVVWLLIAGVDE